MSITSRPARVAAVLASAVLLALALVPPFGGASSHREAPAISQDPAADGTDFYMFRSPDAPDTITFVANYYPFQEPAGGPNFYRFGDDVLYAINIDNNGDAIPDITYYFSFTTQVQHGDTFLYNTGPITSLTDPNWNVRQYYKITKAMRTGRRVDIANPCTVPPNNIGPKSTPNYDALASAAICNAADGVKAFAGQRDDPFFVDLGATFDLLTIRPGPPGNKGGGKDDLAGYNVMSIVLQVPISQLTSDGLGAANTTTPVIGGWTTASRTRQRVLITRGQGQPSGDPNDTVQVSRLGAPLVNEVVVPLGAKDLWNNSEPKDDAQFLGGVTDPEAARLLHAIYGLDVPPTPRMDLVAIFLTGIPNLNQPANVKPSEQLRLNVTTPITASPNRLGVLGGDNQGFPNGRRLADDVVDIALQAVAGGTPFTPAQNKAPNNQLGDGVNQNDKLFSTAFPYLATPTQGFDHTWPGHRMEPVTP